MPTGSLLEADVDWVVVAASHRTPVLKAAGQGEITPLIALERYYHYTRQQLAVAGGYEITASIAMYGMGRVYAAIDGESGNRKTIGRPKAMILHQAAQMVDH